MYKISPLTPLFFNPSTDAGLKSRYIQEFCKTDHILLQIIGEGETSQPSVFLYSYGLNMNIDVEMLSWQMNDNQIVFFKEFFGLDEGIYSVVVEGMMSEPFIVKEEIKDSVLIQYSNADNKQRTDTSFYIDGMHYFFDFRVPGGFKDDDWAFGVDNEQYTTSNYDVLDIYASSYTTKTLTLGNARGCPIWFGDLLNRLLCCHYVYIDGIRYTRMDSNIPELNIIIEGVRTYVIKQSLRKVEYIDGEIEQANQYLIRRTQGDTYRMVDGEVLTNNPKIIL